MPDWSTVLSQISREAELSPHDRVRRRYLKDLSDHTGRNVIAYYSGFLNKPPNIQGMAITDEDKNGFMQCIHELDRSRGLDLVLHTPGGEVAATESLVYYLRSMFGRDIRAIVPQIAMSAGTVLACSCRKIILAKHSNLGPADPQFGSVPALALLHEVERAYQEMRLDQSAAIKWHPILSRIPISFLQQCEWAVERMRDFLEETLKQNMFCDLPHTDKVMRTEQVVKKLTALEENKGHSRHFHIDECKAMALEIEALEDDATLQDLVLTVHHCYMHTLSNGAAFKIIENQNGKAIIKQLSLVAPAASAMFPTGLTTGG